MYTPNQSYRHFLMSTRYVALALEMAVVCYVITLKAFNHTLCEALDLDLKGQAQVQGWNKIKLALQLSPYTSEFNQSLQYKEKNFDICLKSL